MDRPQAEQPVEKSFDARAAAVVAATPLLRRCHFASRLAGLLGVCVGLGVLLGGWACDIGALRTLVPGYPIMVPSTALGLFLCGTALWLDIPGKTKGAKYLLAQLCGGIPILIGVATLFAFLLGEHVGVVDRLMFPNLARFVAPGGMAVMSAVTFMLLGGGLLLCRSRRTFAAGQYLVVTAGVLSLFAVIGYVYGITSFYWLAFQAGNTPMAVHTSLTFVVLCAGALLSRPDWGLMATISNPAPGGVMARRLLPAALLIPVGAGWLRWQGELRGLYGTAFGVALFTAANVVVFTFLIWRCGQILNGLDRERTLAETNLRQLADLMPQIVWTANAQGESDYYNQRCYDYNGLTFDQTRDGGWEGAIHPDEVREVMEKRGVAFATREPYSMEYRFRRASDGMYRWHLARGIPVFDPAGEVVRWLGSCTDVQDIKMAQDTLRHGEAQFRRLADYSPQLVWTANGEGAIDYYNQRWYDYTGLNFEQSKDRGWQPVVHPEDAQKTLDSWTQAFTTCEPYEMEFRLKRASDKMYRWHLGRAFPISDVQGAVVRWFGTCTDIHALKSAEEALRRSELQFKQLADSMPQMVWTATPEGNIDYYNQRWHDYTGMTFEETKNWGWRPVLHPDDLQNTIDRWTTAFETCGPYEIEYRFRRADGVYRWHLGRALPIRDAQGKVIRWFGTCTDIHQIKSSEEALRGSELQFKQLADSMPQIVWAATPDGKIDYSNQRWHDYTGMTFDETKNWGWRLVLHPEDAKNTQQERAMALANCVPYHLEYRFKRVDGVYRWHLGQAHPIRNAQGAVVRWFGTCTDIEDYKQAEAQIRSLNEGLERRVQERTVELDRANRQLAAANEELQEFASVASHDLQEPLRKVQAFGDRLKIVARDAMDAQGQDYLDRMLNATKRMRSLIEDLLKFARVSSQAQPFLPVDLAQITREVLCDLEVRIAETNARLEVGELASVEADAVQMRQLLQNLIGNALKFQQPGKPPVVRVYGEKVDNVYHLVVEDQGIGFDEKYRERIFAVFQRLHGRTEYEGTGVGLAICRKIAHRHGGDIGATSTPGRGARFVVALPFLHASSHTDEIPTVAPAADLALLNAAIDLNPRVTSTDRRLL